jgi:uncharacterized membrane protein
MATAPHADSTPSDDASAESRSLFSLLRDLPGLLLELLRVEIERAKREMARKLKNLGVGAAFIVVALSLTTFFFGTLIAAAVFGFAEIMPTWAAALVVAGILLVVIVVLLAIAVATFKKGSPPLPTETFDSIVDDANALKGKGRYDKR